jgi:hypothetical protein
MRSDKYLDDFTLHGQAKMIQTGTLRSNAPGICIAFIGRSGHLTAAVS